MLYIIVAKSILVTVNDRGQQLYTAYMEPEPGATTFIVMLKSRMTKALMSHYLDEFTACLGAARVPFSLQWID